MGTPVASSSFEETSMTEQQKNDQRDDISSVTGEARGSTAANIGRDGDALVQDDVVYGTDTKRQGSREDREQEIEERKAP
jgi:hypothetical protein